MLDFIFEADVGWNRDSMTAGRVALLGNFIEQLAASRGDNDGSARPCEFQCRAFPEAARSACNDDHFVAEISVRARSARHGIRLSRNISASRLCLPLRVAPV